MSKMTLPLSNGKLQGFCPTLHGKTLFWFHILDSLCAYNIEEEMFYELPMPGGTKAHMFNCLRASDGALFYAEKHWMPNNLSTAWILDNKNGQLSGITQDVAWVMTHKIDSQAICRAYNLTWNWNAGIEFIPLAFHLINPNMLFVKITSWKFAMLDKDKNEVTLVYVNIQIKAIF